MKHWEGAWVFDVLERMTSVLRWWCVFQGPSLLPMWSAAPEVAEGATLLTSLYGGLGCQASSLGT